MVQYRMLMGIFLALIVLTSFVSSGGGGGGGGVNPSLASVVCSNGNIGDLNMDLELPFDVEGFGDNLEWYLLDEIEMEVEVGNDGNDDLENVIIAWGLYNNRTGQLIVEEDNEDNFELNDGNDREIIFDFQIYPDDFENSDENSDFIFYIKVYEEGNEDNQCVYESQNIEIILDDNFVVLDKIVVPDSAFPGTNIRVENALIWNIGDDDQEDVTVAIVSESLGINKVIEIGDIDTLSRKFFNYEITISDQAIPGNHVINFEVLDESGDIYENNNGDEAVFLRTIQILPELILSLSLTKIKGVSYFENGEFKIENTGDVDIQNIVFESDLILTPSGINSLKHGESQVISVSMNNEFDLDFESKMFSILVKDGNGGVEETLIFNVQNSFCEAGETGNSLEIKDIRIENKGEGNDDKWKLFDIVEVEVEVKNTGNEDIEDVIVELGFFDYGWGNIVDDFDFISKDDEEIDVGDLNDGEKETVIFEFRVPVDFDEGNYKLTVKVFSEDLGEENECTATSSDLDSDFFQEIEIEQEDDEGRFIAFDDITLSQSEAECNGRITLDLSVANIGDEDQERVRVNLINGGLRLNLNKEISNLDEGDDGSITFNFIVPSNVEEKIYLLELSADYGYDDREYEDHSEDDEIVQLKVNGCEPAIREFEDLLLGNEDEENLVEITETGSSLSERISPSKVLNKIIENPILWGLGIGVVVLLILVFAVAVVKIS